jgi:hypothetical protein
LGEEEAKMAERRGRSEFDGAQPMTREELAEFRRHLLSMDRFRVMNIYREAWYGCRMDGPGLPNGRAVQELVQAWKALRCATKKRNGR